MVALARDIRNKSFVTSGITNLYSRITLPPNMGMDIDDFGSRNFHNYDEVKDCTMTSNKTSSRTVSISSSKISVDYATRME